MCACSCCHNPGTFGSVDRVALVHLLLTGCYRVDNTSHSSAITKFYTTSNYINFVRLRELYQRRSSIRINKMELATICVVTIIFFTVTALKFIKSNKGGKILTTTSGYMYYLHNTSAKKATWRCVHYQDGCRGVCHTTKETRDGTMNIYFLFL